MKKYVSILIILFSFNTSFSQSDNECGCEWNGTVTPELAAPPCEYTDNREDDSYRTYAAYACCMQQCKETQKMQNENKTQTENSNIKEEESESQSYKVLNVDTSKYEADKMRKRQLAEERRQQQADQDRRDREYQDRKDAFEKEQLGKLNRSTQAYEQRQTNLTNAGNTLLNAMDNMSRQTDANRARQTAIYEEEARQRSADRVEKREREAIEHKKLKDAVAKKIRDREELKAKEERESLFDESQREFANSLEDQPIPLVVTTDKVFFFMVDTFRDPLRIKFAPFTILADANNQIPFRKDIIYDFKLQKNEFGYKIYGPYYSKYEQEDAMNTMASQAERLEFSRESDLQYVFVQDTKIQNNTETDFWGDKPKKTTTKKKKNTSFWDN